MACTLKGNNLLLERWSPFSRGGGGGGTVAFPELYLFPLHSTKFSIYAGLCKTEEVSWILFYSLNLLHSQWPKLYGVLAILSAIGLKHFTKGDNIGYFLFVCLMPKSFKMGSFLKEFTPIGANSFLKLLLPAPPSPHTHTPLRRDAGTGIVPSPEVYTFSINPSKFIMTAVVR